MATTTTPPSAYAFQVWAVDGAIVSGHESEGDAKARADAANAKATAMGLVTRYEVRAK